MKKTNKTKSAYEQYLNELFADSYGLEEAKDQFIYLTNKSRNGGSTTERSIENAYHNHMLGTLQRKYDPIAFNVGYNEWK